MAKNAICATCEHFTVKDYPQQAENGLGCCTAYDQGESPAISFVAWDQRFTVLYRSAQNMAVRKQFVAKMRQQQSQTQEETQ